MKFAHIADSHLGSWRKPELEKLNFQSFERAIDMSIEEQVEFILFTGDLFDSPFPSIEILKEAFAQFRKLKDAGIKSYVIAGSHDYSVSGKTFLSVLEKAGFCEICKFEETEEKIVLKPKIHKSYHIYGYPGKKSGLEIPDIKKLKINEPFKDHFRILMLHTTIKPVAKELPIDSLETNELPKADYYALGHIHVDYNDKINEKPVVYGGPTFPNNFKELEELKHGKFYIVDIEGYTKITKKEIKIKDVETINIEITNALNGTEKILSEIEKRDINDKIVLLRVHGELKQGKKSDIKFKEIEEEIKNKGAYSFLKNTSKLEIEEKEFKMEFDSNEMDDIEDSLLKDYEGKNPSKFNSLISPLMDSLNKDKQEGEKNTIFESRLLSEVSKIINVEL